MGASGGRVHAQAADHHQRDPQSGQTVAAGPWLSTGCGRLKTIQKSFDFEHGSFPQRGKEQGENTDVQGARLLPVRAILRQPAAGGQISVTAGK